ncbi:hypothetical protein M9H77_17383 [Catharanthus roseus]|uniref:Uncharacterized protein n=1 Tax=Catharanthus roseus TaxID=4058 RepID=A0ACC0B4F9_CATRO|nr:hypothetical protein M9H77_17383 [Catharanthus roseus]
MSKCDGCGEEGELREGSDDAEELQEPRGRETEQVHPISIDNRIWQVSKVVKQYNHELHPSMSRFMLPHRSLSSNMKRKLEMHETARLKPNKSVRILEVHARGPDKLECLPRDCRNYV